MIKFLKDNFAWIKDIGIVVFMIFILYFNAHFVSLERFDAAMAANELAHDAIQTTLASVDKTLALLQQNNTMLTENEKQIKVNTALLTTLDVRVKMLESMEPDKQIKANTIKTVELEGRVKVLEKVLENARSVTSLK
jgi:hypothetical protein